MNTIGSLVRSGRRIGGPRSAGLTIVELMMVLAALAVIIAIAAPSMRGMMARQRVQGVQADLLTDLQLARSEMAQRSGAATPVAVTFGSNTQVTCYTVHAVVGIACDCTLGPGSACGAAPSPEIKTTQVTRAVGVTLSASSAGGSSIRFTPPQGLVTPTDMVIDVQGAVSGHLRTSISGLGVPTVCSPDGSIRGVVPC
jgi:type IV fimbrial biogenesis protein FimT